MPETFADTRGERSDLVTFRAAGRLSPEQRLRALELIDARLDGDLSVAELAGSCGLSGSSFRRAFKKTTGVTPHRWLMQRRVDRAKDLLFRQPTMPLAQIALASGFADQSHFTHVFTAIVGAAPGEWRRQEQRTIPARGRREDIRALDCPA
jgi:AraC family transcriptional regulator